MFLTSQIVLCRVCARRHKARGRHGAGVRQARAAVIMWPLIPANIAVPAMDQITDTSLNMPALYPF